jgi:UDP-N-acetylmuramate dehydrogenase
VPITDVRDTVLALRRSKGMVLDDSDPDTWSAGSFFTNPVLDASAASLLPDDAPRFPAGPGAPDGAVKTSAAWLIEHAGFRKGFAVGDDARASLSTKHTLALTNRGGASAADLVALARAVRDGVRDAYGIALVPEPVTVGIEI